MKEKLIIRNFGPIRNVELELGRFNVLIGEQATGKSTVAKLLAVCRYFSYIVHPEPIIFPGPFYEGLMSWGLHESIQNDSYVSYECEHYFLETEILPFKVGSVNNTTEEYPFFTIKIKNKSVEFKNLLQELEAIKPVNRIDWRIPTSFFQNDVASVLDNPTYIYTERGLQSIFSLGKNSIPNMSDSLYNFFDKTSYIFSNYFKTETEIEPLDIDYKNENGKGFIKGSKHGFVSLANAASGFQSTIPIVLLIKYYTELKVKEKTFIIEEPEMNLFPSAQDKLIRFVANRVLNYRDKRKKEDVNEKINNSVLITTHSPYILTSLNNLMYAYQIGQNHKEEVNKVIEEKYWVDPSEVSAYQLLSDGDGDSSYINLIAEDGLLMAENIDVISRTVTNEYDLIQDIKLGIKSETVLS